MDGKREIKRCIIITGMSGAGKSSALNVFEDQGFYAIDNLPPAMLPQLMEVLGSHPAAVNYGVAAVVDARGKELLNDLSCVVEKLREKGVDAEVPFHQRIGRGACAPLRDNAPPPSARRRKHNIAGNTRRTQNALRDYGKGQYCHRHKQVQTARIQNARAGVDWRLRRRTFRHRQLVRLKYGAPEDADYILDVRFLPNPNYVDDLHMLSRQRRSGKEISRRLPSLKKFLDMAVPLPRLRRFLSTAKPAKNSCISASAARGGRHRSVAVAEIVGAAIASTGKRVVITHRDIDKGGAR